MSHYQRQPQVQGFTLIEIVVAMTLLALLLAALMPALQTGMNALTRGDAQLRALLLAESLLAERSSDSAEEPVALANAGVNGDLAWEIERTPYTGDESLPAQGESSVALVKLVARVRWGSGQGAVELATLSLERAAEK